MITAEALHFPKMLPTLWPSRILFGLPLETNLAGWSSSSSLCRWRSLESQVLQNKNVCSPPLLVPMKNENKHWKWRLNTTTTTWNAHSHRVLRLCNVLSQFSLYVVKIRDWFKASFYQLCAYPLYLYFATMTKLGQRRHFAVLRSVLVPQILPCS